MLEQKIEFLQKKLDEQKAANLNQRKEMALVLSIINKPLTKNGVPQDVNIQVAKTLLQQDMAKKGLTITFDESNRPLLKQKVEEVELDYYVDNKVVTLDSYSDIVLAENKFLQADNSQEGVTSDNNLNSNVSNAVDFKNSDTLNEIDAQLKEIGL